MTGGDIVQSADTALYAMNPKISRPGPEFAKYDVAFWNPKTQTQTAAAKPGATKQSAAVKKEAPKQ